jgi:hypothetical protein
MISKTFDTISKIDIDSLISNKVLESKTLEYKLELPGNTDKDKKEFLADVSSFGNASGGDLIYGLKAAVDSNGQKTGTAESVVPLTGVTPDTAKLWLEDVIRNGIAPRLRVQIKEVTGWGTKGEGFVIVVRVPQSPASPHMVTFDKSSRFYSRNSAGKYPLDVQEIRAAILATESQADRIKRFRENRIGKIVADETPVVLAQPSRLILHIIPISSFLNNERLINPSDQNLMTQFKPIITNGWDGRINLDGHVTWSGDKQSSLGYCQIFTNGTIEAVITPVVYPKQNQTKGIPSLYHEVQLVNAISHYLKAYKSFGIMPPVSIFITVVGCKGAFIETGAAFSFTGHLIERDTIFFPDVVIDSLDVDIPKVMKPSFDILWNACGYVGSSNYDSNGNWNPQR